MLLPARFHQTSQAAFGCCEHKWVNGRIHIRESEVSPFNKKKLMAYFVPQLCMDGQPGFTSLLSPLGKLNNALLINIVASTADYIEKDI